MTDLFDWLTVGDSGLGLDRLGDAFNLSPQEIQRIAVALTPAYARVLRRAVGDPALSARLLDSFLPFMGGEAMPGDKVAAMPAARRLTESFFDSAEIRASIAREGSSVAGIAPDVVESLMHNLSVMVMQTMTRTMLADVARHRVAFAKECQPMLLDRMGGCAQIGESTDCASRDTSPQHTSSQAEAVSLQSIFSDALNASMPLLPPEAASPSAVDRAALPGTAQRPDDGNTTPLFETMLASLANSMTLLPATEHDFGNPVKAKDRFSAG